MHYLRSWVEILVNSVAKTHEPEGRVFVFCLLEYILNTQILIMNFFQHRQDSLIGSSMIRSPQGTDPSRYTSKGIRKRATCNSNRRSGCILLMISMANPNNLHSPYNYLGNLKLIRHGVRKHHIKKVLHIPIFLLGPDNRQPHRRPVRICRQCRHLGYHLNRKLVPVLHII